MFLRDRRSIWCGWIVTPVVPRTVNVSKGRMSLRIATTKTRENRQGILYVFADCNDCVC